MCATSKPPPPGVKFSTGKETPGTFVVRVAQQGCGYVLLGHSGQCPTSTRCRQTNDLICTASISKYISPLRKSPALRREFNNIFRVAKQIYAMCFLFAHCIVAMTGIKSLSNPHLQRLHIAIKRLILAKYPVSDNRLVGSYF